MLVTLRGERFNLFANFGELFVNNSVFEYVTIYTMPVN